MTFPNYINQLIELTHDMWSKGWDEYNGGNVSYRLTQNQINSLSEDLEASSFILYDQPQTEVAVMPIPDNMQGQYLLMTASGSQFRNLKDQPQIDSGIIKLGKEGYRLVAGFNSGKKPTSEIFMHILAHSARLRQNPEQRVVVHNHATHIVIYSLLNEVSSESLTLDLWSVLTESIIVFPDGLAVLPWQVPGTYQIGLDTASQLANHRLVVWAKHGVLSTGTSYQDCFGLIETVDKAAKIALDLQNISGKSIYENNSLSKEDLRTVCQVLKVDGQYL